MTQECGWKCGDPAPGHKHYAVVIRDNGKLVGRLTPHGHAAHNKLYAAILSHARADEIARDINTRDDRVTAKVIPF